ncbi:MAG: amidohydrolase family protein [Candidatus Lokiarchaeota archaeon]|nr:amidohydrolase family protein [Candidatus Lokiarchaeota archaeon]
MVYSHNDFKYIDMHTHFFPKNIFRAIWNLFESKDDQGKVLGWPINYKHSTEELVKFLKDKNVREYTTYNYAHKKGVAKFINSWTIEFVKNHKKAIPFGCVFPEDEDRLEYVINLFEDHNFKGIKLQPLVQNFYLDDERMHDIYKEIIDRNKWLTVHAGTAPYTNKYLGFRNFLSFIKKFPNINVIVAHLGTYEYEDFFSLIDRYENLYLDTSMVYVPEEIYYRWKRNFKHPSSELLESNQERLLYGSDFPNIPFDYEQSSKGLLKLELPKSFYRNIFYGNAKKILKNRKKS